MNGTGPARRSLDQSVADLRAALECAADGDLYATLDATLFTPAIEPLARALNRLVGRQREAEEGQRHSEAIEEALHESKELFQTLASLAPVGIFRTDAQGLCTYVNEHWRSITGMSLAEALGGGWQRALHPDDRDLVYSEWQRAVDAHAPFRAEYRFQRPDGQITWVLGQAIAEINSAGELRGYVGTITDMTERKQAERALQESETRYRNIFEHAAVSLWEEDCSALSRRLDELQTEGISDIPRYLQEDPDLIRWAVESIRVLDVNQQSLDLFGARSKEELLGGLSQLFLPETFAVFADAVNAIAAGRTRFRAETPMRTLDGRRRDVLVSITFPREPSPQNPTLVSVIDITERKQAEEALWRSEQRYRTIFEGASVAIWEADYSRVAARLEELRAAGVRDFRSYFTAHPEILEWAELIVVRDVNEESLKLFGAASKTELLRSHRALYLPETIPLFVGGLVAFAEGQRTFEAEVPFQTLRGEHREVLVSFAFPAPGTSSDRVLICNTDITAWKRVEEALRDAERGKREAARTAADVERRRLARELHDGALQDLSAVKLLLEAERKRGRGDGLDPALTGIGTVMGELRAIVDELRPGDLSQASLQEAIAAHASWLTRANGIALTLDLDPDVRIAAAGARDLYRIAQEALANAVRHGCPNRVAVRLSEGADSTLLEIGDDGSGFDVTARQHGMGLLNMRERAAALGGDLDIVSATGQGTRIRVTIPTGNGSSATAAPAAKATGVTASRGG